MLSQLTEGEVLGDDFDIEEELESTASGGLVDMNPPDQAEWWMAIEDQAVPESLYRNAINLNRYQTSVSKKLINRYNDIIVELTNELRNTDIELTAARQLRISTILRQLEESLGTWAIDATNVTKDELQGLASLQSDFIQEQLKKIGNTSNVTEQIEDLKD